VSIVEMFPVVRTSSEPDINADFVALGYMHPARDTNHAAFIIKYNDEFSIFHYTGRSIEYEPIHDDYHHRRTETIGEEEVPAFIALCRNVKKHANPRYGFFYSGEFYKSNGDFVCDNDTGERMTCVGFCLNVLKGFLEEEYLQYNDWEESTHNAPGYLEDYCEKEGLDIENVRASHRRVSPLECMCSAFFTKLPIRKEPVDQKVGEIELFFSQKFNNLNSASR
jgi:hypothetical protein